MLTLILKGQEYFNEETEEFIFLDEDIELKLEHSLVSLSKWESKYLKSFLGSTDKTEDEVYGYIEAMVIEGEYTQEVKERLTKKHLDTIQEYISSPQSATTFTELKSQKGARSTEVITSELIYFWMVSYNVPTEYENWHLNRLFALLRICGIKNSGEKSMSKQEIAQRNRELNAERKAKLGTSG